MLGACGSSTSVEPVDTADRLAVFDRVHADVEAKYSYFDRALVDWTAVRASYRDSVVMAVSRNDADRYIGRMVQRLFDYHAAFLTPNGSYYAPPIRYERHFDVNLVFSRYVGPPRYTTSRRIRFGRLGSDLGYVGIQDFGGSSWGNEIDEALAGIGSVRALIIDVRDNGGGDESIARVIASRFYDRSRTYRVSQFRAGGGRMDFAAPINVSLEPAGAQRFTGPVVVITNRFNGSSAEDFICMMRILPQVTTLGDTTIGNGSNPLNIDYGTGYGLRIPQSRQSTPDGFVYQYVGLPPRVPVRWTVSDTTGGRDPYLDAAMALLRGGT